MNPFVFFVASPKTTFCQSSASQRILLKHILDRGGKFSMALLILLLIIAAVLIIFLLLPAPRYKLAKIPS